MSANGSRTTVHRLERVVTGLAARNVAGHVVDDAPQARALLQQLLPPAKQIFTANSMTLRDAGILADIDESGDPRSLRAFLPEFSADLRTQMTSHVREQIRVAACPPVVVGSLQAITEDGIMVAASDRGTILGAYAAAAEHAFWIVGEQKVVPDLEAALLRIRSYCLPQAADRIRTAMPEYWKLANADAAFIGRILIMEREFVADRSTVILVRDSLGV
ncbi:LUD domain-containing protein [Kribbella sp. NPDC004536]|uniref:LUD domain-containing protein n=1 Tax=Kribbella sp. NPDC004536 TaxID=3364106 RepID=UPI0036D16C86